MELHPLIPGAVLIIAALASTILIVHLVLAVDVRRREEERHWEAERPAGTGSFAEVYDWAEEHDL